MHTPLPQEYQPVPQQKIAISHSISVVQPPKKEKQTGEYLRVLFLRTLGNFLIFSSLFMIVKTFYQPVSEEIQYLTNLYAEKEYVVSDDTRTSEDNLNNEAPEEDENPGNTGGLAGMLNLDRDVEVLTPEDPSFSVVIPKIGANARIVANVDAGSEEAYLEALKSGVAHVKGTAFPGEAAHIFLFAHSTDYIWNIGTYNAVFYLLYKLEEGDEVNLFYNDQRYVYTVTGSKIIDPSEVEYLTRQTDEEFLTLQTCWPPGTTLKRLLIFAERKASE